MSSPISSGDGHSTSFLGLMDWADKMLFDGVMDMPPPATPQYENVAPGKLESPAVSSGVPTQAIRDGGIILEEPLPATPRVTALGELSPNLTYGETRDRSRLKGKSVMKSLATTSIASPRQPLLSDATAALACSKPYNVKSDVDYWKRIYNSQPTIGEASDFFYESHTALADVDFSEPLSLGVVTPNLGQTPLSCPSVSPEFPPRPPQKKQQAREKGAARAKSRQNLNLRQKDLVVAGVHILDGIGKVKGVGGISDEGATAHHGPPVVFAESQNSLGKRRRIPPTKLQRPTVKHRPITRSMSKVRKVHVHCDNFSPMDLDDVNPCHPDSQYVIGTLLEEYEFPVSGSKAVKVALPGFSLPFHFMADQVMIGPLVSILPTVEYAANCVCCCHEGETQLPSEIEVSDLDYKSDDDPTPDTEVERTVEADHKWEAATAEEVVDLTKVEEHFRYSDSLPFDKMYHDVHWLRESNGIFGSKRSWLGTEEVGVPRMEKTSVPGVILDQFLPISVWVRMVRETNRYAKQKARKGWKPVTVNELKCWMGICIFMGIKRLPELEMYWNRSHPLLACRFIADLMSRDRWLDIMGTLHLVNNESVVTNKEDERYDKISKIRWFIDEVTSLFRTVKPVDRFLSLDEMMVKCLARRCPIKQFSRDKPSPHGMKVWALASAVTKYVYALEVFCGSQSGPGQMPAPRAPIEKQPQDKPTYKVVMHLMQYVPDKMGHVITMDNYFTSVPLFVDLLKRLIYCTGTARPGILGWPSSMAWSKKMKGSRGDLNWRMHASGELGCCVWHDRKPVGILSSFAAPWEKDVTVVRTEGSTRVTYPTSPSLLSYIKLMRGVDVADQIRAGYSVSRRGRRWWKRLFFFVIDSAICNAWVIGNQMWEGAEKEAWAFSNHLAFNIELGDNLVYAWRAHLLEVQCIRVTIGKGPFAHGPVRSKKQSRKCVVCGVRTFWMCSVCEYAPAMCVTAGRTCYQRHHQQKRLIM